MQIAQCELGPGIGLGAADQVGHGDLLNLRAAADHEIHRAAHIQRLAGGGAGADHIALLNSVGGDLFLCDLKARFLQDRRGLGLGIPAGGDVRDLHGGIAGADGQLHIDALIHQRHFLARLGGLAQDGVLLMVLVDLNLHGEVIDALVLLVVHHILAVLAHEAGDLDLLPLGKQSLQPEAP